MDSKLSDEKFYAGCVSALVSLATPFVQFAVTVVTLIWGWGLEPQSWPVIVGGTLVSFAWAMLMVSSRMLNTTTK